ncbi:metallophosphatase [Hyalangium rubrum]|uniref:Metallophosphatase n=1 Tax=Hyalangium rubrum TaxID=3103134 RepID=A0ABU5GZX6_9BACT|nr:metallophosphatase [Hyalangium sp. s54d21]MDY7226434.1 metallophosphatase [Hyalangium sp. s54d21]
MSATVVLHACAGGPGRLRVWLGARARTTAPTLSWSLDGQPAQPEVLRPIKSVRSGPFLGGDSPRVFAGLYDFPVDVRIPRPFRVSVSLDGAPPITETLRALPNTVPFGLDKAFHLMLASCFYWSEDKKGLAGISLDAVLRGYTPDMLLLAGDQVYLDLPPIKDFPLARPALARKFEEDYARNWFEASAYAKVLHSAPYACVPDDHDYWNNFPMPAAHIQNTWTQSGRDAWGEVARMLYGHFQHVQPTPVGTPVQFDVEPLSFFLLDARSWRDANFRFTMTPEARDALSAWVSGCIRDRKLGVFATGQSLFMPKAGDVNRRFGDSTMNNYGDYRFLMGELDRLMREAGDVLLLTGDMHWGRVVRFEPRDALASTARMYEVISSPTALVETPGSDQWSRFKDTFSTKKDRWFRHSDATLLGGIMEVEGTRAPFQVSTLYRHRGNNVCLLSFRRHGDSLEVTPRYFPLEPGTPPNVVAPFVLRHR